MLNVLLDLLRNRTSIRIFTGEDISMEIIEYILEAEKLSTYGVNEQS